MNRRHFDLALCSMSVLALSACASLQRDSRPETRVSAVSVSPPVPRAEEIPAAPSAQTYWIPGHWKWNGTGYVWAHGHWEQPRANMVYQPAYWASTGAWWVYHPARWVSIAAPSADYMPTVVTASPPAPRIDAITPAPGPGHVWISGYWRWHNGRHAWVPGHWEGARSGYFWAPGHWMRHGPKWSFSGGFWQRY
jgi:hypothetical protein